MNIQKRINALRSAMAQKGIDIYIIPTADFHHSEYVGDYFKFREYMTGFTGSAGTAVFTSKKAGLWTDGRYFIQAEQQLAGSGIDLYRSGEPGVPSIEEFLEKELQEGQILGFDGRTISYEEGTSYRQLAEQNHASVNFLQDLASEIWTDRPDLPSEPAFLLEDQYTGEGIESKLTRVRLKMKEYGCDTHILSSLDDIAWLFNIRGNDIAYCPLVLSYAIVYNDSVELFADTSKFSDTLLQLFAQQQIILHPYEEIYDTVSQFNENQTVLLDSRIMNYSLYRKIPEFVTVVDRPNPEILMKCIKNDVQVENLKAAHLKDGIAHTRFMYWLKTNSGEFPVTELSASQKLEEFRAMQNGFIGPSFAPISAYGEHGAIVHYSANEESNVELKPGKLL